VRLAPRLRRALHLGIPRQPQPKGFSGTTFSQHLRKIADGVTEDFEPPFRAAAVERGEAVFIDSHAHLDMEAFAPDREEVLRRARTAGVRSIISIGVSDSLAGIESAVALAEKHDGVFATVGVHPHDAAAIRPDWLARIETLTSNPRVVGVGETGLDYHYLHSPRETQLAAFRGFVRLARSAGLPVVIHTRSADQDTLMVLEEAVRDFGEALRGVVHCFSGSYELARRYLDLGLDLSFTGVITFPKAGNLREVVRAVPLDRVHLETDCPYLAPEPHRGRRNEPAFVVNVAETLARVLEKPVSEIGRVTSGNTARLFRLPD